MYNSAAIQLHLKTDIVYAACFCIQVTVQGTVGYLYFFLFNFEDCLKKTFA